MVGVVEQRQRRARAERGHQRLAAASRSASSSRVPCRNSIGTCTSSRCARALVRRLARPGAAESRGTRGRATPGSGAIACACEVMRPPNDLPPANSGRRGQRPRGLGHGGAHGGMRDRRRVGALRAALHVGELVAQRRDAALGQAVGDRGHERVRHAGAGAVREHVAGARAAAATCSSAGHAASSSTRSSAARSAGRGACAASAGCVMPAQPGASGERPVDAGAAHRGAQRQVRGPRRSAGTRTPAATGSPATTGSGRCRSA